MKFNLRPDGEGGRGRGGAGLEKGLTDSGVRKHGGTGCLSQDRPLLLSLLHACVPVSSHSSPKVSSNSW